MKSLLSMMIAALTLVPVLAAADATPRRLTAPEAATEVQRACKGPGGRLVPCPKPGPATR